MIDLRNYAVLGLGGLAVVLGGLLLQQRTQTAAEREAHANTRAQHAHQLQRLADNAWHAADAALRAQTAQQKALAAIDSERTKERDHAIHENDRLRAAVRAGTVRLRLSATCPARPADGGSVPSAAPAASVDPETATLTADAGQAFLDTREALIEETQQLLALQDYVRRVCPAPATP